MSFAKAACFLDPEEALKMFDDGGPVEDIVTPGAAMDYLGDAFVVGDPDRATSGQPRRRQQTLTLLENEVSHLHARLDVLEKQIERICEHLKINLSLDISEGQ